MKRLRRSKPMHDDGKVLEITRRHFFGGAGFGIGSLALAALMDEKLLAQQPADAMAPKPGHHPPRAKNVIFLFMAGGPSQLDLFDYKPKLKQYDGEPCPEDLMKGERFAFIKGVPKLLGTPHKFKQVGSNGTWMCELLPNTAGIVDDIAIIRSMNTDQFNHAPAELFLYTGNAIAGNAA